MERRSKKPITPLLCSYPTFSDILDEKPSRLSTLKTHSKTEGNGLGRGGRRFARSYKPFSRESTGNLYSLLAPYTKPGGGANSSPQPWGVTRAEKVPMLEAASGTMQESGAPLGSGARDVCSLRKPRALAVRAHARRPGPAWGEAATRSPRPGWPSRSPRTWSAGARSMAPAAATGPLSRCGERLGPLSPWPPARV